VLSGGKADEAQVNFEGEPTQIQEDDHILNSGGNRDVVLIEYGDFECPGCAALYAALKQVEAELGDDFTFVFRHFPLTSIHRNAFAAHRAAEAAGRQGQFFAMHDMLYENQEQWNGPSSVDAAGVSIEAATALFEQYASALSLDIERFKTDFASEDVAGFINKYVDSGQQLNLSSTPTLLLNGQQIQTPSSVDQLKQILQEAIDQPAADA
jgi:protein-disulfide isomerase